MLVTGASRGIGAAIARLAAAAGYTVVVNYAASADAAKALADEIGNDSFAVQADVGDEQRRARHVRRRSTNDAADRRAGQQRRYRRRLRNPRHLYGRGLERLWAVNLTRPFLCAREAAKRMRADGRGGSIINISSKAAVLGGHRTSGCTTRHQRAASTR